MTMLACNDCKKEKRVYKSTLVLILLFLIGCSDTPQHHLDGKKLIEQKCAQCHNIDLPPKTYDNEVAPPMMAVAFHLRAFVPARSESDKIPNAINFVKEYVISPSASKSYCDKESLKSYGVMPSQKGKVTQEELQAIAEYMFKHFTQKNLDEAQAIQRRLKAMPQGERLALQNGCLGCHKKKKDLVGPSFEKIAKRYKNDSARIFKSIKNGSKWQWEGFHGVLMPSFGAKLSEAQIETISQWISTQP